MDKRIGFIVLLFVATAGAVSNTTESPCFRPLRSLSACTDYIYGSPGRTTTPPSTGCCHRLTDIIRTQPLCLCEVVQSDSFLVQNRAVDLPRACNLTTPPASLCPPKRSSGHPTNSLGLKLLCFITIGVGMLNTIAV